MRAANENERKSRRNTFRRDKVLHLSCTN